MLNPGSYNKTLKHKNSYFRSALPPPPLEWPALQRGCLQLRPPPPLGEHAAGTALMACVRHARDARMRSRSSNPVLKPITCPPLIERPQALGVYTPTPPC